MKLKAFIISVISLVIVGIVSIALYVNWNAIKGTIDESKYYTSEDLQNSYDNGFSDGSKSETELTAQVAYFKGIVDEYYLTIVDLQKKNEGLQLSNNNLSSTVSELESLKSENEQTIEDLQITISENENNILILNNKITKLQNTITNSETEILGLNQQINNYKLTIQQLQNNIESNLQTINSLNTQIVSLNSQISSLKLEISNNSKFVNNLQKQIYSLEDSIKYYESFISQLENDTQVVATFEYDGSIYNIQILNKGNTVSVSEPAFDEKAIFNGWTVNGEIVDLSNYIINKNTKFVADLTYKNVVSFICDGSTIEEQYVVDGGFVTEPTISKDGYEFDGWSLDGNSIIDVSTYEITEDTIFVPIFTQVFEVTFIYENEVIDTQLIRNGSCANAVDVEDTMYKDFNNWSINGSIVDVTSYVISLDTTFIADITYLYDVTFTVDSEIINSQIVAFNNYAITPSLEFKSGYIFRGWSLDGFVVEPSSVAITKNSNFIAIYEYACYSSDVLTVDTSSTNSILIRNEDMSDILLNDNNYKAVVYFNYYTTGSCEVSRTGTLVIDNLDDGSVVYPSITVSFSTVNGLCSTTLSVSKTETGDLKIFISPAVMSVKNVLGTSRVYLYSSYFTITSISITGSSV